MDKHVFISHVRDDADAVDRLCAAIKKAGVSVWRDSDTLEPGEFWPDSIRKVIRDSAFFVACFSDAYFRRDRSYIHTEIGLAIEELAARPRGSKWFLPVLLSDCSVPALPIVGLGTLQDIHAVSLHHDWHGGVERLLRVLLRERRDRAAPAPATARGTGERAKRSDVRATVRLRDLKESVSYDAGYELLSPEERYLLGMAQNSTGVTISSALRYLALRPERIKACLDRLTAEELLSVEESGGEHVWRLSQIGKTFLSNNDWARLV